MNEQQTPAELSAYNLFTKHEGMANGEMRFRLKRSDGSGYVRTVMGDRGAWQSAHYHSRVRELYVVQSGWIAYAETINGALTVIIYEAGEWMTTEPTVIHNVFMGPNSDIHTVKFGEPPGEDDRIEDERTRSFSELTQALSESDLRLLSRPRRCYVQVSRLENILHPTGIVLENHAHQEASAPHATVLIAPFRFVGVEAQLLVYRRPSDKIVDGGLWDIFGGHVEVGDADTMLRGCRAQNLERLERAIWKTAVDEAREELPVPGFSWDESRLQRFDRYGEFGTFRPTNREFSTLFVAKLPCDLGPRFAARESSDQDGSIRTGLRCKFQSVDSLLARFQADSGAFADGLGRLLIRLRDNGFRDRFRGFLDECQAI